jgi:molybdopterin-containing oxidoreductase family membrane subunit
MSATISPIREPLVQGNKSYHDITVDLISPTESMPGKGWWIAFLISVHVLLFGIFCILWTIWHGIGTWNLNRTIGWGWDITNFVWWIGIGHAGTLISAILLLFRQKWRTGVNRAAEAMTIFAVMCAGLFPIIHMGRVWMAFFIFPYPNTRGSLWPNFNSPLLWDVFAISTYFTVSLLFWYTGLVPDFATVRDRATGIRKKIYNFLCFGWTGAAKHWQRWEALSLVLAGIATPLVLSVHTIVSFDFATSVIPGWHTTIFPPYFVAGAIFSGFAMVQTLMLITRKLLHLEQYITIGHIESMNKVILATGTIVGVAYLTELFIAWYSGYIYEQFAFFNRALGPYYWSYFGMMFCNVVSPQVFWSEKMRRSVWVTFFMSIFINIGMWFERFVIIATTLARDYLPSSWSYYVPTWVEIGIFIGTMGLFGTLYLLFTRVAPVVAVAEIKAILKSSGDQYVGVNSKRHNEVIQDFQEAEASGKVYDTHHAHTESH